MAIFNAHPRDRLQVFIDGANLYATCRTLYKKFDYGTFIDTLKEETRLVRAQYFQTIRQENTQNENFMKVLKFLDYNGYDVVTKNVYDAIDQWGHTRQRGSMDVDMAVAMVQASLNGGIDHAVIFSGNRELVPAVQAMKDNGTRVTVVSSVEQRVVSDELRVVCDEFEDIEDMPDTILVDLNREYRGNEAA